jgi:hypothetical protein
MGPNQLTVGVPTWFAIPFGNIFGDAKISYTPTYKVYVTEQSDIAVDTTINMQALSREVELGSALTFEPNGEFVSGGVANVPAGSIGLYNKRPASTPQVTVGLAGMVNMGNSAMFLPFCAFTLNPQNSIIMTPLDNILLVAARQNLQSGNVQANVAAPGCNFSFSSSNEKYQLMVLDKTFAITNVPGTPSVSAVSSGSAISIINNK